jgi:hypothetical protein
MARHNRKNQRKAISGRPSSEWTTLNSAPKETQQEIKILQMRDSIDPKRHYKKGVLSNERGVFQVGRIIDDPTNFYSRVKGKDKKKGIVDTLLEDKTMRQYYKEKFQKIQQGLKRRDWKRKRL